MYVAAVGARDEFSYFFFNIVLSLELWIENSACDGYIVYFFYRLRGFIELRLKLKGKIELRLLGINILIDFDFRLVCRRF